MNEYAKQDHTAEQELSELDGEPPEPEPRLQPSVGFHIPIANEQTSLNVDSSQIESAVRCVLESSDYRSGSVSVAVVDDPTIHEINRDYLNHDYPTDVLSFVLEDDPPYLEGELVISTDTAIDNAVEYNWSPVSELLLYAIHGTLHLVGYRDKNPKEIKQMRTAEAQCLAKLNIALPNRDSRWENLEDDVSSNREVPSS